jgi:hypothetical protein
MKSLIVLILALAITACSSTHSAKVECGAPSNIPETNLLLVGEFHGTVESPQLVGQIACARSQAGPVAVGLEIPTIEQTPIDSYLNSDGSIGARTSLVAGPFWQSKMQDGRSSQSMVLLLERLRNLHQSGLRVTVFAFDSQEDFAPERRNERLASTIRVYKDKHSGEAIVALMGNKHATQASFYRGGEEIVPTGKLLEDLRPISVLLTQEKGTIWACTPDCGVHDIHNEWVTGMKVGFVSDSRTEGYTYVYVLPSLTASPPAVALKQ